MRAKASSTGDNVRPSVATKHCYNNHYVGQSALIIKLYYDNTSYNRDTCQ